MNNYYNISNLVSIRSYTERKTERYSIKKKGIYKWRLFGKIPLFKYEVKETLYYDSFFIHINEGITAEELLKLNQGVKLDENENVYLKPYAELSFSDGISSVIKCFDTNEQLEKFVSEILKECSDKGIFVKNL